MGSQGICSIPDEFRSHPFVPAVTLGLPAMTCRIATPAGAGERAPGGWRSVSESWRNRMRFIAGCWRPRLAGLVVARSFSAPTRRAVKVFPGSCGNASRSPAPHNPIKSRKPMRPPWDAGCGSRVGLRLDFNARERSWAAGLARVCLSGRGRRPPRTNTS